MQGPDGDTGIDGSAGRPGRHGLTVISPMQLNLDENHEDN